MAGDAGNCGNAIPLIVFIEAEIFLIDLSGHLVHMAGDILFRFRIAGEIQVVRSAVGGGGMTEIAFYAEGGLPGIHRLLQVVMADIFWQYFEIVFGRFGIILWADGSHTDDHQAKKGANNSEFFVRKHDSRFDALI